MARSLHVERHVHRQCAESPTYDAWRFMCGEWSLLWDCIRWHPCTRAALEVHIAGVTRKMPDDYPAGRRRRISGWKSMQNIMIWFGRLVVAIGQRMLHVNERKCSHTFVMFGVRFPLSCCETVSPPLTTQPRFGIHSPKQVGALSTSGSQAPGSPSYYTPRVPKSNCNP